MSYKFWRCPRCRLSFLDKKYLEEHIDINCWRKCDACASASKKSCLQDPRNPGSCRFCTKEGLSCTQHNGPMPGLTPTSFSPPGGTQTPGQFATPFWPPREIPISGQPITPFLPPTTQRPSQPTTPFSPPGGTQTPGQLATPFWPPGGIPIPGQPITPFLPPTTQRPGQPTTPFSPSHPSTQTPDLNVTSFLLRGETQPVDVSQLSEEPPPTMSSARLAESRFKPPLGESSLEAQNQIQEAQDLTEEAQDLTEEAEDQTQEAENQTQDPTDLQDPAMGGPPPAFSAAPYPDDFLLNQFLLNQFWDLL